MVERQESKQKNPYPPRSIKWALIEEDWSDLTVNQIAEVFGDEVGPKDIHRYMGSIKHRTGYVVPFKRCPPGRKRKDSA